MIANRRPLSRNGESTRVPELVPIRSGRMLVSRSRSAARSRDFYGRQVRDWKGSAEIEQNERDYRALTDAVASGAITAQTGL